MKMNPKLIYDVGMHQGQDTEFYLKKGFDVVAIEANPSLVEEQRTRFDKYIKNGRLKILNIGIGRNRGKFTFYVNDYLSEWSSFDREIGTREGRFHEIEVDMVPLEDILAEHGAPYYLKIDIEGHDFIALESIRFTPDKPRFISVENGQKPFLDFLYAEGYTRFKFINQQKVPEQQVVFPQREGVFVRHIFPHGASGLFGEETPGEWLDYDNVLRVINAYWENPNRDADIDGWFDLHARLDVDMSLYSVSFSAEDVCEYTPISTTLCISMYTDDVEWKNGVYLPDTRFFFITIGKNATAPVKPGDLLRFKKSGDARVTEVSRLENPGNASIFIKVDRYLDPYGDGSPNEAVLPETPG
jgi:FkbM family methyltransferase